jgi:glycosyltransferase involved in cell wall biosynthesis
MISVIIPTLNRPSLKRAIDSTKGARIIKTIIKSEGSCAHNRNLGLRDALSNNSNWIVFLDDRIEKIFRTRF